MEPCRQMKFKMGVYRVLMVRTSCVIFCNVTNCVGISVCVSSNATAPVVSVVYKGASRSSEKKTLYRRMEKVNEEN